MVEFLQGLLGVFEGVAKGFTTYGAAFGLVVALAALVYRERTHAADKRELRADLTRSEEGRRADIIAAGEAKLSLLRESLGRAETLAPLSQDLLAAIAYQNGLTAEQLGVGEPRRRNSPAAPRTRIQVTPLGPTPRNLDQEPDEG